MVIVNLSGREFYMNETMKPNLDFIQKKLLGHNNMSVIIVDGRIGTGKSTVTAQYAYYLSNGTFNNDFENFNTEQFNEVLRNSGKGDAVVLDEAFDVLNKRRTQTTSNMLILSLLQQMRIKHVFIFIVLPSVFDLDKNLVLNLADMLIHCYRKPYGARGQYKCYSQKQLKRLWINGRNTYSYSSKYAEPNFIGNFTSFFPFDYNEYERKKLESIRKMIVTEKADSKYLVQRNKYIKYLYNILHIPVKEIAEVISIGERTVYDILDGKQKD